LAKTNGNLFTTLIPFYLLINQKGELFLKIDF